jgi:nitrogen fixation NifU-like protein
VVSDLRELYQSVILDHNKRPRNFGELAGANRTADGHNPLCGDRLRVQLAVEDGRVVDAAFSGSGCAIFTASASLMTEAVKGRPVEEVEKLFGAFHDLVTGPPTGPALSEGIGKLAVFGGVREFPVRVKCATLAWHTLRAALAGGGQIAKTE